MTDFLVSQSNPQLPSSDSWRKEDYPSSPQAQIRSHAQSLAEPPREINLREALEWLLGSSDAPEMHQLTEEEKLSRKERRMELLIWLMNLELRLSPYGEPA